MDIRIGSYIPGSPDPGKHQESPDLAENIPETLVQNLAGGNCLSLNLESLPVTNQDLIVLLGYCPAVESISLAKTQLSDLTPLSNCRSLRKLDLRFCQKLAPNAFYRVFQQLHQLVELDCSGCSGFNEEAAKGLAHCKDLYPNNFKIWFLICAKAHEASRS